ncbi:hypothetical protein GC093_20590 [Paenibacillus sp. LMG 31456]|uniref:5-bromo-4-chloroindolyl phosphate hydrolysis protein n=1 Tax=Paenibacillus foliorum TaxID=2654974 RepID=A0A972GW82_9BACL|nr:hypothetical protein [Paenibacillus foliorum]NOU95609.1 hypothetical protein [Paenibacillus foliorum]
MKFDEDRVKKWLINSILFILLAICIMLMLLLLDLVLARYKLSGWDPLAFLGAIIGGFITLVGVRMTINNQYKMDFINKHPLKLKNCEDVFKSIDEALESVYYDLEVKDFYRLGVTFTNLLRRTDELNTKAASVSPLVYYKTTTILYHFEKWNSFLMGKSEKVLLQRELVELINAEIKQVNLLSIEIGETLIYEAEEYEKITRFRS